MMVTTLTPMVPYAFGFAAGAILFIALRHLLLIFIKVRIEN